LTRSWIRDEFVDGGLEASNSAVFDIVHSSTRHFWSGSRSSQRHAAHRNCDLRHAVGLLEVHLPTAHDEIGAELIHRTQ
jgi:hypothetical protein